MRQRKKIFVMGKYDVSPQKGSFLYEPELAFKKKVIPFPSFPFPFYPFSIHEEVLQSFLSRPNHLCLFFFPLLP